MLTCHSLCQLWAEAKGGVRGAGGERRGRESSSHPRLGFVHRAPTLTPRPDTSATLLPVSDSLRRWRGIKVIAERKQRYRDSVDTCDSDMRGGNRVWTSTCSSLGDAGEQEDQEEQEEQGNQEELGSEKWKEQVKHEHEPVTSEV